MGTLVSYLNKLPANLISKMERLTDISAGAVMRRLRKFCHVWSLEIPKELRQILINAGIKRNKMIRKLKNRYQNNVHLFHFMEEKQQEYNKSVENWETLVKTRNEDLKQKEKQWEKIKKLLKAKQRMSSILTRHLQTDRKTRNKVNKLKLKRRLLQIKRTALDQAKNDLLSVKETNNQMTEIITRMKQNVKHRQTNTQTDRHTDR